MHIGKLLLSKTDPLGQPSGSFGDALDSSVKKEVFTFVIMHFHNQSIRKTLFLGVREGILITLLIEPILLMIQLRVHFAIFGSLDFLARCSRPSTYVFSIDSNRAFTIVVIQVPIDPFFRVMQGAEWCSPS